MSQTATYQTRHRTLYGAPHRRHTGGWRGWLGALAWIGCAVTANAAPAVGHEAALDRYPVLRLPLLAQAPEVDGTVDPAEWAGALRLPPLISFVSGFASAERTEVYLAYTEKEIVAAWRVHRPAQTPLRTTQTKPGYVPGRTVWADDVVELFFNIKAQAREAIIFAGNAAGAYGDARRETADSDFEPTWGWRYAARATVQGWEGELALDFAELGLSSAPAPGTVWGFEFQRNNKTPAAETETLANSDRRPERFARLIFGGEVPAVRVVEAGSIGDASVGLQAEIHNGTGEEQTVVLQAGILRRRADLGTIDFLQEYETALQVRPGEIESFATPEKVLADLLAGFEAVREGTEEAVVPPGERRPLALTAHPAQAGDYLVTYRFTDPDGEVLLSGLTPALRRDPVHLAVIPYYLPDIEQLEVDVSLHTEALRQKAGSVAGRLMRDDKVLAEGSAPVAQDGPTALLLSTVDVTPGPYRLEVVVQDAQGEKLGESVAHLNRPTPPEWLTGTHGTKAFVPPPFTPVEVEGTVVRVWGREYRFDDSTFLPTAIFSDGENLLSASPRVILEEGGRLQPLEGSLALVEADPEQALLRWTGRVGNLPLRADIRVEFDGFMTFDVEVEGGGTEVGRFWIEWPVATVHAADYGLGKYYNSGKGTDNTRYSHGRPDGGLTGDGFSVGFNHMVWLGSAARGLEWVTETAEHWRFADPGRVIDVEPDGKGTTVLRLRVIDRPTKIGTIDYRWGLAVGPVRPYQGASNGLYVVQRNYQDGALGDWPQVGKNLGANWAIVHQQWNQDFSFSEPFREIPGIEERAALARGLEEAGLRSVFYTGWNGMTPKMADWPHYGEAMRRVPTRFSYAGFKPCTRGGFVEYLANGAAWMQANIGVGGVFLDATANPEPCANPLHGCGFVDPDSGERIVTRDIWGRRELFKRLYKIFHGELTESGMIYSHGGDALAVDAFVTFRHTGESEGPELYTNPDLYRANYGPFARGIPVEHAWRAHHSVPRNLAWAMALLHDNRIKLYPNFATQRLGDNYKSEGIDWRMWVPLQWFDWEQPHQWHGYWDNAGVLGIEGPDHVYASFRSNAKGQLYFNAANLGAEPASATFQLDLAALDLPAKLHARDAVTNETMEIDGGRFSLDFAAQSPRVLMISPEPVPVTGPVKP